MKYKPNISRLYPQRQTPRPSVYDLTNQQRRRGPSQDAAVAALIAKGTSLGYSLPTTSTQTALNTYVTGLKDAGIWTKLDILYIFATDGDSDFATLNLKNPDVHQCTKVNSPTHTSLEGFTGNGSTSYLNTNYNPTIDGTNYTLNNASYGFYFRTVPTNLTVFMGSRTNSPGAQRASYCDYNAGSLRALINQNSLSTTSHTASLGFASVTLSGTTVVIRSNATESGGSTITVGALSNFDFYILSLNNGGAAANFSNTQLSISFAGAFLSSTESGNFYTLTEAYMDALGKGVV